MHPAFFVHILIENRKTSGLILNRRFMVAEELGIRYVLGASNFSNSC